MHDAPGQIHSYGILKALVPSARLLLGKGKLSQHDVHNSVNRLVKAKLLKRLPPSVTENKTLISLLSPTEETELAVAEVRQLCARLRDAALDDLKQREALLKVCHNSFAVLCKDHLSTPKTASLDTDKDVDETQPCQ